MRLTACVKLSLYSQIQKSFLPEVPAALKQQISAQPESPLTSEITPYRVGGSPLFGSGVIAVLPYVKLVGRTEMDISLLESFENRPCEGRGEQHEKTLLPENCVY